jgi:predicted nucleic acid-binding protein
VALLRQIRAEGIEMVTTDHVLAETVTLLKARGAVEQALALGDAIVAGKVARYIAINTARRRRAWELFRRYRNLRASYVDCTSFAVMEELDLQAVFGFDADFEAARFRLLG